MWTNDTPGPGALGAAFAHIDCAAAARRIAGSVTRTPLIPLPGAVSGAFDLRGKMENRQVTGSFKARGALNNILQLTDAERARGVVASSSGNHGRALAWAARRAGVPATIVMPQNAYPNKIDACRAEGATVVLAPDRIAADDLAQKRADDGLVWVHPYDRAATVEGAGTVGVEIAEDWPDVDVIVICVGGGGLSAGTSLALRRALGDGIIILGAEPSGAAAMEAGLRAGETVHLDSITSEVQGLTTTFAGHLNVAICRKTLDGVITANDDAIFAAQKRLVNDDAGAQWTGEVVEPAGAAAYAVALDPGFGAVVQGIRARRGLTSSAGGSLRVAVTISGGNPAPAQLASQRT